MARNDPLKVLMLADFEGRNANVIQDYLYSFNAYSRHTYYYYHDCVHLDAKFDFSRFDAIVFFWSCYWFWQMPIGPGVAEKIAGARGVKLLFQQDEYRNVRHNNAIMARLGIDVILTCVAEVDHGVFYPRSVIPSLKSVHTVLTGYVPEYMEKLPLTPLAPRPIDIGYRSRVMPFHLGDLAREKLTMAQRFERIAADHGFTADVSVRESDRLYGKRWLRFLASCKFALGTESGASVVDLTGEVHARCAKLLKAKPAASYEEVREACFADVDGKLTIQTISPRIFESVAYGNVLVLHEGEYAGMLRPDEHFIAVRKDYSNVAEVVARMRDPVFCERLRTNAHNDLIASGRYSYRAFVRRFDDILAAHVPAAHAAAAPTKAIFYLKNYVFRAQGIIPAGSAFVRVPRPTWKRTRRVFSAARQMIPQIVLVLGVLWDIAALRYALAAYYLRPWRWDRLRPAALWPELVRLGLLRCLRGRGLTLGERFEVSAHWSPNDLACHLVSRPADDASNLTNAPAVLSDELRTAIATGRCRSIVWNHSAVGTWAAFACGSTAPCVVAFDSEGTYAFQGLDRLIKQNDIDLAVIVEQTLGGTCGLQSWRGLRFLLLLYALPANLLSLFLLLFRSPANFCLKAILILGLLWDVPALRGAVARYLVRPWRWRRLGSAPLLPDLMRLGIIRCARGVGLVPGGPFRLTADWRAAERAFYLVSEPREEGEPWLPFDGLPAEARTALAAGRCRKLAWDHSAVATWTALTLPNVPPCLVVLDKEGTYTFRALAQLTDHFAADPVAIIRDLLADRPCALQSWKGLALLVACFRAPFIIGRYVVTLTLNACGRGTARPDQPHPALRLLLVLGLLWDVRALRRACVSGLLRPWRWHRVAKRRLWSDLVHLGALRCTRGRNLLGGDPFELSVAWKDRDRTCILRSVPVDENDRAYPPNAVAPVAPRAAGRCRRVVWDHSAVATWTIFGLCRYRYLLLFLGAKGVYTFRALMRFCDEFAADPAVIVDQVLAPGPCALQSWTGLSVLTIGYKMPFALVSMASQLPGHMVKATQASGVFGMTKSILYRAGRFLRNRLTGRPRFPTEERNRAAEPAPSPIRNYRKSA